MTPGLPRFARHDAWGLAKEERGLVMASGGVSLWRDGAGGSGG